MATYYVYSGAGGAGTGVDWANAFTTMTAALSGKAAGDIFFVAHDHAESTAGAVSLTFPGSAANPNFVYCADRAGTVPPVSADLRTTGSVTTTGNNALTINQGVAYINGLIFSAGSGAVAANLVVGSAFNHWFKLENCQLIKAGTSTNTGAIQFGSLQGFRWLVNTTVQFGATGDSIVVTNTPFFRWENTPAAIQGATLPTTLFNLGNTQVSRGILTGVDLSALGSGKTLMGAAAPTVSIVLQDCKLGASVTIAASSSVAGGPQVDLIRCDSGGTNYRHERYWYQGSQVVETTIVRTGGATDGTTPLAWKLVTTANSRWVLPFEAHPIRIWNDVTGSNVTVTVYGIWGGGAVPNNDQIWIEVEYLGDAGSPQGSFKTTTKADNLAAGSAVTADGSTWGGSTTKFKMVAVLTSPQPAQKGYINITVKAATASTTFYIDPEPELS